MREGKSPRTVKSDAMTKSDGLTSGSDIVRCGGKTNGEMMTCNATCGKTADRQRRNRKMDNTSKSEMKRLLKQRAGRLASYHQKPSPHPLLSALRSDHPPRPHT